SQVSDSDSQMVQSAVHILRHPTSGCIQITVARLRIENLRRKDFYGQFMNRTLMEEAYMHWSSGNSIEAGRLIYDQIPNDERPSWAAEILDLCRGLIPRVPEIDAIYEIASDRS